jgi:hypothetical protein
MNTTFGFSAAFKLITTLEQSGMAEMSHPNKRVMIFID